ncbi:MAG TPA: hypothetical protein VN420_04590 [Candidatus Fimivivens sp.]|nr:hypothetical protein [Candidatus Fimivivens sp.]
MAEHLGKKPRNNPKQEKNQVRQRIEFVDTFVAIPGEPGSEALGCMLALKRNTGIVHVTAVENGRFRLLHEIKKGEKIVFVLLTLTEDRIREITELAKTIVTAGGVVTGIACVVNDTFPVLEAIKLMKTEVPVISLFTPSFYRYRWDAPEVSAAVGPNGTIM